MAARRNASTNAMKNRAMPPNQGSCAQASGRRCGELERISST